MSDVDGKFLCGASFDASLHEELEEPIEASTWCKKCFRAQAGTGLKNFLSEYDVRGRPARSLQRRLRPGILSLELHY